MRRERAPARAVVKLRNRKLADKLLRVVGDIDELLSDERVNHECADPGERRAWRAVAASLMGLVRELRITPLPKPRRKW